MTATHDPGGSRFRLRFLLQEFALPPGETIIGRSDECQITIFDPLISRKHARISVQGDECVLEDLGSRNGCRVNGVPIQGPQRLKEGDRIRLGKHELVFSERPQTAPDPRLRQTGSLVYCASCDMAYPSELGMCPSCGSRAALDEDTRSGVFSEKGKEGWALDMLVELFDRALTAGRPADADRIMRQIMAALESLLKNSHPIEPRRLEPIAGAALRLADLQNNAFWVGWAVHAYGRAGAPLTTELVKAAARWDDLPTMPQMERDGTHGSG
jgi:hypothetical protein